MGAVELNEAFASQSLACIRRIMGLGPVPRRRRRCAGSGLSLDDIGAVELNEAFASQSLACIRR
ncbi:acetyl-CoA C-acyltransferase, partial [Methylobacterium radiotolerans]